jgi:hypothetical protein
MEPVWSSETSLNFYWTTEDYIPVCGTFHSLRASEIREKERRIFGHKRGEVIITFVFKEYRVLNLPLWCW